MPLRFGKEPKTTESYCIQKKKQEGFRFLDSTKKIELYHVNSKTASTTTHYEFVRPSDTIAVGLLDRKGLTKQYIFRAEIENLEGKITFSEQKLELIINDILFHGKILNRAKEIEIYNQENQLTATIDKKILTLNDKYHVVTKMGFSHLAAQMLTIAIDDYFHEGTVN